MKKLISPRARIIIDNDFGGDPDGLFQLAHHLLSPSVEIRGIIGSHHHSGGFYGYPGDADYACAMAGQLLELMALDEKVALYKGANESLENPEVPISTDGANFIIQEAMRDDVSLPLYLACGAGLTDIASALLIEPKIAERLTLVWIGGPEYEGLAYPPPGPARMEYNLSIDLKAAQVVFNRAKISIWQVPRSTYRQALISYFELVHRVNGGKLWSFLLERLQDLMTRAKGQLGEAYVMGDSPLVLLTALQSSWETDPSSSMYRNMPCPFINDGGCYEENPNGRVIRVYTSIDTRLMLEDLYAKLAHYDKA